MYKINNYKLSLEGFELNYCKDGKTINIKYDPLPACDVLKGLGIIKDFDWDINLEPVVTLRSGIRQDWSSFVKLLKLDTQLPGWIAEYHYKHKNEPYQFYIPADVR